MIEIPNETEGPLIVIADAFVDDGIYLWNSAFQIRLEVGHAVSGAMPP
jgi:hypothetical protein